MEWTWNGQFHDDDAEVELQVPILVEMEGNDGETTMSAQHIFEICVIVKRQICGWQWNSSKLETNG